MSYVIWEFPCALGRTYWPDRMKRTRNLALKAAVSRKSFWGGMDEQGWCFYHLRQLAVDMISCQVHTNTSLLRVTFHLTMVHFFGISQFMHPCNPKWSVSLIPPSPCAHLIHDTNTQERHNFWYWRLKLVTYISIHIFIYTLITSNQLTPFHTFRCQILCESIKTNRTPQMDLYCLWCSSGCGSPVEHL